MTFAELLSSNTTAKLLAKARSVAKSHEFIWNIGVQTILKAASENPDLAPKIAGEVEDQVLQRWMAKYTKAEKKAISLYLSNLPGTVPDPIIGTIILARLPHLTDDSLNRIIFGHRLAMSAENVLGLLLEEYLAIQLAPFKWHCCWGKTLRSVDFVNEDGRLLQIKNRSNSENSSSSRVRIGTNIEKWFRVDAASGQYLWDDLRRLNNNPKLTEDKFKEFVMLTLERNPQALPVEDGNPWKNRNGSKY